MGFVMWMFTHKLLVFFIGATAAFAIATTVLGVNNTDLISQLDEKNSATSTPMPPTEATPNPPDMSKYRLPRSVTPVTYDLYLYPNLETGLFRGRVLATVTITEPTSKLVLHSNQLKVNGVSVGDEPCAFELDAPYELLTVQKNDNSNFPASSAQVAIDFEGDMRNRIVGLYVSSYNSATGTVSIATSKFEPTYARQAFPCFDEPNFKATYKVHLLKPTKPNYIALSNYPETGHEETPEGTLVHFQETVPMSTYLSCFIVSDFVATETEFQNKENKVPFRVYASPNQLEKTRYAGEVGKKVIEYYVDYFDIPFPLPKLDLVAIPDFVSGAMEHWGLVTFRETALLYTSETHSSSNKQRVATVVAHELAHSWFGNLVTLDWWNDLWLNEGFASYIEYKGTLKAEPTWGMLDQFLVDELHPVLSLDATQGSHPIIVTVATPDQITEVFDTISYNKGASVLRMLEYVTGEDNFRKGVTSYLNKFAYKNAVTQDLLNELQTVIGDSVNITEFMNTFTVQMGYPILDVTVTGNKYTFRQKRFLKDPTATAEPNKRRESPLNYKWSVPISYMTDLGASDITWLLSDANEVSIDIPAIAKWVKFNPSQVGYYRVNYPEAQWRSLINIVNDLPIADRTHLLEESFSIAESGDLSYTVPLDLTKYLVQEVDYVPWNVASATFGQLKKYLTNSQAEADLKAYVIGLLKNAYATLSWEEKAEDEHLKRLARVQVLSLACAMEYDVALAEAKTRFDEWIASGSPLSQDLRSIIYKYGMVKADEATWNKLLEIFVAENDANEKLKLMNGLASVQNPALLIKFLELAKSETYVRSQDYLTLLQYIAANPAGTSIVWDYVRDNWQYLVDRFTLNSRTLGSMIPSISSTFSTETKLDEMRQFFKRYPEAGAGAAARNRALESIENNIKWLSKYKTAVENWLKQNKPDQS